MYRCSIFALMAVRLVVTAGPPSGYYVNASGATGEELKVALHEIINDHTSLPYSSSSFDTHDALQVLDQDPENASNVILIYSRRSEPKSTWPSWNREHLWPNSLGIDDDMPAYSDLHNLRACDANVNSSRGNEYYDWSDTNAASYVIPAHVEAPLCSSDSDSWEPPDPVKGDVARALFYMSTRYTGDKPGEPLLALTDSTADINSSTNFMGRLTTLLKWHRLDPVDDAEETRNDGVYTYQGNRNPFVDQPDWVEAMYIPRLSIEVTVGGVRLRWPSAGALVELETSSSWPPAWGPVQSVPYLDGQDWCVDAASTSDFALFRLALQD